MKTTVILVRHGETLWNRQKRLQGQTDIPLTPEGVQQAEALAKKAKGLGITVVYSSVLARAAKTADIIAKELHISVERDKDFNERSFGDYEGNNWQAMEKKFGMDGQNFRVITPPNGEGLQEFASRVIAAFNRVVRKHPGETILIVCHGGVLHSLVRHLRNIPQEEHITITFANTSLSIFHLEKDLVIEEMVADASHLPALRPE